MRIDDLNGASQSAETAKAEGVRQDDSKSSGSGSRRPETDGATISEFANALSPSDARLEALRLQVERGDYGVSAKEIAGHLIDENMV